MKKNLVFNSHRHSSSISRKYDLKTLLGRKNLANPFLQGRNVEENAAAYKIFSILYGLVVFMGGVAFSISSAIIPSEQGENIKDLAVIYFTSLYWVSIIWIIFCIVDIVRHKRRLHTHSIRVNSLDSNHTETNLFRENQDLRFSSKSYFNLRTFSNYNQHQNQISTINEDNHYNNKSKSSDNLSIFRSKPINILISGQNINRNGTHAIGNDIHQQKDSIVHRDIGYNYDDRSTTGGLYIRVGIGIFCLGTVIHSGLSILSNLENFICVPWTNVVDDFSRLLFSFVQFFFIFKHSNLIIRVHENFARLAVMHVVVTNLCVWFRMVVNETKSQIQEMSAYETIIGQYNNVTIHSNYFIQNGQNLMNRLHCRQSIEDTLEMTSSINQGSLKLKPLLYPCTIEFSLMCLTLFFLIWENIGKTFTYKMSDKASTKNVFMVNCHASIKGFFAGMVIFSCTVISIILYAILQNNITDDIELISTSLNILQTPTTVSYRNRSLLITSTHSPFSLTSKTPKKVLYSIAIVEIVNLCLLIISLFGTTWTLIKIRKFEYKRITTRFDSVLIIVSLSGIYLYSIFSAFALFNNKNPATWIAYLKIGIVILEFIEGTVHAFFILVGLRKRLVRTNTRECPAREVITLLIMLDLSLWFEETTTTTKHEVNPFQLAFYHVIPWSIIAAKG